MTSDKKYLLSTRPLPKAVTEEAAGRNVVIEEFSFIDTKPIEDKQLFERIKTLAAEEHTVVFTSMSAVEAVAAHADKVPGWQIYSIGNTTRKLIEEKWGADKIVATADYGRLLGERLIDDGVEEVVFFCGNIRRDELPNKIRSEGGKVEEVVVYETAETPTKLSRDYDGILFFSPSAVHSFYSQNKPGNKTVLFAIGKTTAEAIRQYRSHKIVVGNRTDKVDLAQEAVDYLTNNNKP